MLWHVRVPPRRHRGKLHEPGHPLRMAKSVDEQLHAQPGPADERHPFGADRFPDRLQVTDLVIERDLHRRNGIRPSSSPRVVQYQSPALGQRVELSAVIQGHGRHDGLFALADDAVPEPHRVRSDGVPFAGLGREPVRANGRDHDGEPDGARDR